LKVNSRKEVTPFGERGPSKWGKGGGRLRKKKGIFLCPVGGEREHIWVDGKMQGG